MKKIRLWGVFLLMLSACSTSITPTTVPSVIPDTSVPATATQPASRQPAPAMSGIAMFEGGGWGWHEDSGLLYRSTDAGKTWQQVQLPGPEHPSFWSSSFLDLNTAWLAIPGSQGGKERLLHTTDGGKTWLEIVPQGVDSPGGALMYHFISPSQGWAQAAGVGAGNLYLRIFETYDAGAHYQVIPVRPLQAEEGLPEGTLHLCNICTDSFYYGPSRIMIFKGDMASMEPRGAVHGSLSFDLGQHWQDLELPLPPSYHDALVSPLGTVFINEDGFQPILLQRYNPDGSLAYRVLVFYTSHDGGRSWALSPGMLEDLSQIPSALQFIDSQDAVVVCGAALCVTHDAARTWQSFPLDTAMIPGDTRSIMQVDFVSQSTGWIIVADFSQGNSSYSLFRTEDGGKTWILQ